VALLLHSIIILRIIVISQIVIPKLDSNSIFPAKQKCAQKNASATVLSIMILKTATQNATKPIQKLQVF